MWIASCREQYVLLRVENMKKIKAILEHAEQQCKSHGTRLTTKRKQVLSGLLHAEKALSAYELIDVCKTNCTFIKTRVIDRNETKTFH